MKIGQKREMMMDTSIKVAPTPSGNSNIQEDKVFDKTKVEKPSPAIEMVFLYTSLFQFV